MRRLAVRQMVIAAALAASAHAAAAVLALHGSRPGDEGDGAKAGEGLTVSLGLAEGGLDAPLADVKVVATVKPLVDVPEPVEAAQAHGPLADVGPATPVAAPQPVPTASLAVVSAPAPAIAPAPAVSAAPEQAAPVERQAQPAAALADALAPRAAQTARSPSPQAPSLTEGRAHGPDEGDAGGSAKGAAQVAGVDAAAAEAYVASLQRWLVRHKRYPALARARRIEGAGVLAFAVGPDGEVLSARVTRSAGHPLLDGEIVAMLRRAAPLPPPPRGRTLDVTAPVTFRLN